MNEYFEDRNKNATEAIERDCGKDSYTTEWFKKELAKNPTMGALHLQALMYEAWNRSN